MYVMIVQKRKSCVKNARNIFLMMEKNWNIRSFYVTLAMTGNKKIFVHLPIRKKKFHITMSDNKLVKTIMDAATLTGLAAGIG